MSKEGVRVIISVKVEQVFEEVSENSFFLDWRDVELAFASQTHLRRVHIALGVFDRDMEYPPLFIPMNEAVYQVIEGYKLYEKIGDEWTYLRENTKDAIKQILAKGRIVRKKLEKTGEKK